MNKFCDSKVTHSKNPFCGIKNCLGKIPNHLHSKELDNKRKLKDYTFYKTLFFIGEWQLENTTNQNDFEKEIDQNFFQTFMTKGKRNKNESFKFTLRFAKIVKNIEEYLPCSPKLRFLEKEWKNQEKREEWLKKRGVWERWQELQLTTLITEKRNIFSAPTAWISIAIVLALAAIGWLFYRRRKKTEKQF